MAVRGTPSSWWTSQKWREKWGRWPSEPLGPVFTLGLASSIGAPADGLFRQNCLLSHSIGYLRGFALVQPDRFQVFRFSYEIKSSQRFPNLLRTWLDGCEFVSRIDMGSTRYGERPDTASNRRTHFRCLFASPNFGD